MITFVHTYNPHHPNIFTVVQESRSIWEGSSVVKELFINNTRLISSKCQPTNLKRILTKAARGDKPFKGEITKCGNKRCGCFMYVVIDPADCAFLSDWYSQMSFRYCHISTYYSLMPLFQWSTPGWRLQVRMSFNHVCHGYTTPGPDCIKGFRFMFEPNIWVWTWKWHQKYCINHWTPKCGSTWTTFWPWYVTPKYLV